MTKKLLSGSVLAALLAAGACTVHQTEAPSLSGPSTFARSVTVTAIPDSITRDGASQSSVSAQVIGPDGLPLGGISLRMDMLVDGQANDYGTLSARTVVTGSDGMARVVYTAPPAPPPPADTSVSTVSIRAITIGSDAQSDSSVTADIRLVPAGVILPPAGSPLPRFTLVPDSPSANSPVQFDGSTSCASTNALGACDSSSTIRIASYAWTFGDGGTASGAQVSHAFSRQQSYTVTLTVTNDRGLAASTSQAISVGAGSLPTPEFTFSPSEPGVNETVFFNGSTSTAGVGHTIRSFAWTFGDGGTATGVTASHAYATAGTYRVQLKVTDEAGQSTTSAGTTITVGSPPSPTANFTTSPTAPVVSQAIVFDASSSTTAQGQTIVDVAWNFGDGTAVVHCGTLFGNDPSCVNVGVTNRISTHTYTSAASFVINLVVTDSAGRTGARSATVTVGTGNPVPVITFSPSSPAVGNSVAFDSAGTTTSGGATIVTYAWTFPGGVPAVSASASQTVTFAAAGTYTVRLTVTDSQARVGTTAVQVTIVP